MRYLKTRGNRNQFRICYISSKLTWLLLVMCFNLLFINIKPSFACWAGPVCTKVGARVTVRIHAPTYYERSPENNKKKFNLIDETDDYGRILVDKGTIVGIYDFDNEGQYITDNNLEYLKANVNNLPPFNEDLRIDFEHLADKGYAFIPVSAEGTNCLMHDAYIVKTTTEEAKRAAGLLLKYGAHMMMSALSCSDLKAEPMAFSKNPSDCGN